MTAHARARGTAYRLAVASRVCAAVAGGYAVSALATAFLSAALPLAMASAVLTATMASFLVYTAAVIWVFAAASAWRAWLGLLLTGAFLGVGVLVSAGP